MSGPGSAVRPPVHAIILAMLRPRHQNMHRSVEPRIAVANVSPCTEPCLEVVDAAANAGSRYSARAVHHNRLFRPPILAGTAGARSRVRAWPPGSRHAGPA